MRTYLRLFSIAVGVGVIASILDVWRRGSVRDGKSLNRFLDNVSSPIAFNIEAFAWLVAGIGMIAWGVFLPPTPSEKARRKHIPDNLADQRFDEDV